MNPQGYPSASVPLQGVPYGQPQASMVQYTTVNVIEEPPKDHIIWSIFNFFYMNPFCLGLAALIYSVKARDRKMVGDLQRARHHGSTARNLNIAATVLIGLTVLILIIIFSIISAQENYYYYRYSSYDSSYNYNYRG
ncbi:dispanin subfamily A member 2b-like [Acanthochromis polyacanthus]|uniref:dispanin subfamily A member 2b-like n=1 Tax=Acanthochromis polyacanthus TaxID=80966 RepID=UPI00223434B2|nr:dispanin subfamily A member 2b-like [Acanthochromis polyacanthus]